MLNSRCLEHRTSINCDLKTKSVRLINTRYKNVLSVEGAFAHFEDRMSNRK